MTITNDGATILKLLEVEHPAAKVLCELADLQDKEVGDGTTSVVSTRISRLPALLMPSAFGLKSCFSTTSLPFITDVWLCQQEREAVCQCLKESSSVGLLLLKK